MHFVAQLYELGALNTHVPFVRSYSRGKRFRIRQNRALVSINLPNGAARDRDRVLHSGTKFARRRVREIRTSLE